MGRGDFPERPVGNISILKYVGLLRRFYAARY